MLPALSAIFMLTLSYANGFATLPTELDRPQRCHLERTYKMIGYNCANLNLKEIPQQLKSNLEVSGTHTRKAITVAFLKRCDHAVPPFWLNSLDSDSATNSNQLIGVNCHSNALFFLANMNYSSLMIVGQITIKKVRTTFKHLLRSLNASIENR